jgi:hypothetical protein
MREAIKKKGGGGNTAIVHLPHFAGASVSWATQIIFNGLAFLQSFNRSEVDA